MVIGVYFIDAFCTQTCEGNFPNKFHSKFTYIVKNKMITWSCNPQIQIHLCTLENGNMVMMSKIYINQIDVKLSMSNYTMLTNVATTCIPIGCRYCWPLRTHMPHPKSRHLGFAQVLQTWTWHWAYKLWPPWWFTYLAHIIKQKSFSQSP